MSKRDIPYLDDITVAGRTQEEHDANVKAFYDVVHRHKLIRHDSKSVLSATSKCWGILLVMVLSNPTQRGFSLQELPLPSNIRSLNEHWDCMHIMPSGFLNSL